jgi:hypothetical protein
MMRKVEVSTQINCKPEDMIRAFIDPEMLLNWWGVERAFIEPRVGGNYVLTWNISEKGFGYVSTGVISEYDPGHCLVLKNLIYLNPERSILGPMSLSIRATKGRFHLSQDGYQSGKDWDWYYDEVKSAWPMVVKNLKHFLEEHA